LGVIYSTNSFLPLLRKGETRKVATISSATGDCDFVLGTGLAQAAAYGTSKAAVNMIIAKFAVRLQTEGFTIIALSPGMVDTSATSGGKGVSKLTIRLYTPLLTVTGQSPKILSGWLTLQRT
jgi:NAD(P)-dependent dehydrogenase (short-subunit alcohol dehydrogenase family)